jgi:hypothetical protein
MDKDVAFQFLYNDQLLFEYNLGLKSAEPVTAGLQFKLAGV